LKKHVGLATVDPTLPYEAQYTAADREPKTILDRITVKRKRMLMTKVLIKWKHQLPKDATWEFYYDLKKTYPSFHS